MQENPEKNSSHLKKKEVCDIRGTLKSFKVGDSELILFSESQTTRDTFATRYRKLKKEGHLEGSFRFLDLHSPAGTVITRVS